MSVFALTDGLSYIGTRPYKNTILSEAGLQIIQTKYRLSIIFVV